MKIINAIINLSEFLHKFALFFFSSSHIEEEKVKILGTVYQYSTRVIYNTGAAIEGHWVFSSYPQKMIFSQLQKSQNIKRKHWL